MAEKPTAKTTEGEVPAHPIEEPETPPGFEVINLESAVLGCALRAKGHPNAYDFDPLNGHEAQQWPDGTVRVSIKLKGNNGHKIIHVKLPDRYPVLVRKEEEEPK